MKMNFFSISFERLLMILCFFTTLSCGNNNDSSENLILIQNGNIINYNGRIQGDILIKGEKIAKIGSHINVNSNTKIIDASGMDVLPGGIDPHVHITGPFVDDFKSGSFAAAAGGITTIGNLSWPGENQSIFNMIADHELQIDSSSIVDVIITPTLTNASIDNQKILPMLSSKGYTSIKIFMASQAFADDVPGFEKILQISKKEGILPMIHCEDYPLVKKTQEKLYSEGKSSLLFYAESRPIEAEVKATEWAIQMSEEYGVPVYIVHLSSKLALDACINAQKRGLPVYIETRPIYLYFDEDKYKGEDGQLYTGMPPLRSKTDMESIWKGLSNGTIHVLASDHAPWKDKQKLNPENTISNPFAGVSNLQLMLPMLYSEGILKGRLTIERFVAVTSTNAAKLFGLFPRKGIIAEGSDADIVIWDKKKKKVIDYNFGYSKARFSLYKDFEVTAWPKYTIRRGEVIFENDKFVDKTKKAESLKRNKWKEFEPN